MGDLEVEEHSSSLQLFVAEPRGEHPLLHPLLDPDKDLGGDDHEYLLNLAGHGGHEHLEHPSDLWIETPEHEGQHEDQHEDQHGDQHGDQHEDL